MDKYGPTPQTKEGDRSDSLDFVPCPYDPLSARTTVAFRKKTSKDGKDSEAPNFKKINTLLDIHIRLSKTEEKWKTFITKCEDVNIPENWEMEIIYDPKEFWDQQIEGSAELEAHMKDFIKSQKPKRYLVNSNNIDQFFIEQTMLINEYIKNRDWYNTIIPIYMCCNLVNMKFTIMYPALYYKVLEICTIYINKLLSFFDDIITPTDSEADLIIMQLTHRDSSDSDLIEEEDALKKNSVGSEGATNSGGIFMSFREKTSTESHRLCLTASMSVHSNSLDTQSSSLEEKMELSEDVPLPENLSFQLPVIESDEESRGMPSPLPKSTRTHHSSSSPKIIIRTLYKIIQRIKKPIPRLYLSICLLPSYAYNHCLHEYYLPLYNDILNNILLIKSPLIYIYISAFFVRTSRLCSYSSIIQEDLETILLKLLKCHHYIQEFCDENNIDAEFKDSDILGLQYLNEEEKQIPKECTTTSETRRDSGLDEDDIYKLLQYPCEYIFSVYFHFQFPDEETIKENNVGPTTPSQPLTPTPEIKASFDLILNYYIDHNINCYLFYPLLKAINTTVFGDRLEEVYEYIYSNNINNAMKKELVIFLGKYLYVDNNYKYVSKSLFYTIWKYISSQTNKNLYLQLLFVYIKVIIKYYSMKEMNMVIADIYHHFHSIPIYTKDIAVPLYRIFNYIFVSNQFNIYELLSNFKLQVLLDHFGDDMREDLYYNVLTLAVNTPCLTEAPSFLYFYTIASNLVFKHFFLYKEIYYNHKFFIILCKLIYHLKFSSLENYLAFYEKCRYTFKQIDNIYVFILYRYLQLLYTRHSETEEEKKECFQLVHTIYHYVLEVQSLISKVNLLIGLIDYCVSHHQLELCYEIYSYILPYLKEYVEIDEEFVYANIIIHLISKLSSFPLSKTTSLFPYYHYIYKYLYISVKYKPTPIKLNLYTMFIEGLYHYSQSFDRLYEEDATNPAYLQERETIFTYINKTIKLIYLLTKQYIAENNICEEVLYNPSEDQEQFSEEQSKASLLSSLDTIIKRRRSSMEQYTSSQSMEAYNPLDQLLSSRDGRGRDRGRGRGAREDESANGFDLEMDIDMNIEDHVYTVSNYMSTYFFSVSTIIDLLSNNDRILFNFQTFLTFLYTTYAPSDNLSPLSAQTNTSLTPSPKNADQKSLSGTESGRNSTVEQEDTPTRASPANTYASLPTLPTITQMEDVLLNKNSTSPLSAAAVVDDQVLYCLKQNKFFNHIAEKLQLSI